MGHKLPEKAVVESHGKLLTKEMVNEEDEGKYMCKAKNLHGEAVHYFHVTVEGKSHNHSELTLQPVCFGSVPIFNVHGTTAPSSVQSQEIVAGLNKG